MSLYPHGGPMNSTPFSCRLGLHLWGANPDPELGLRAQCQRCGKPDLILQAAIDQKVAEREGRGSP